MLLKVTVVNFNVPGVILDFDVGALCFTN